MESKAKYITPGIMLFAGALSMIIMLIRQYELYRMLWTLLIVLIIFFLVGDVARYIYCSIKPRVIPASIDLNTIEKEAAKRIQQEPDIAYLDDDFDEFQNFGAKKNKHNDKKAESFQTTEKGNGHFLDDDFTDAEIRNNNEEQATANTTDHYADETGYSDEEINQ